jgi:predicted enzyme related to lactoylglutathione lyase
MPVLRSAVQGFRDEGAAEMVVEADPRHHGADDAMTVLLNIDVPDVEAATTFYTAAFGLTVGRRFGADFVELLGWPGPVYLLTKQAGTFGAGGDRRRYNRHWTPLHLDVVVDDVDAAVARAVRAGAILEAPARDAPYGRIAMLADPFGHGFCLLAFSAEGYDALLGG